MEHELHAARLVEEPLQYERFLRRHGAEHRVRLGEIRDRLFSRGRVGAGFRAEPVGGRVDGGTDGSVRLQPDVADADLDVPPADR